MKNVNQAVSWTKRLTRCIHNKGHSVAKSNKSKERRAKKTSCAQKCAMMQATCHQIHGEVPVMAPLNFYDCLTKLTSKA